MKNSPPYIIITYKDVDKMLEGLSILNSHHIDIAGVFSPYPLDLTDEASTKKRSSIPRIGFWFGLMGAITGFGFQAWVSVKAYPLLYGGKPAFTPLTYLPVTFEWMVLFAGVSMTVVFLVSIFKDGGRIHVPVESKVSDDTLAVMILPESDMARETLLQVQELLNLTGPVCQLIGENSTA